MKGSLPFIEKYLFSHRLLLLTFSLFILSITVVKANTVVVGAGFGYISVPNMNGLKAGDTIAITPGKYTGGSFSNLKGIVITSNGGPVIFNDLVTLTSLVECTFANFQFVNCKTSAIRWNGNIRRCVERNISFDHVAQNCNDAGNDPQRYTGDTSSLKMYMCTFDSLTVVKSGLVLVGNWGMAYNGNCFMDSIVISRIRVDQTNTDGTEVRGTMFRLDCHDWKVTYSGQNSISMDIGLLYVYGNGYIHDIYKSGDRGYIARLWVISLNKPQNSYFYNNIDLNGLEYGSIDIKTEPSNYLSYMTGGNTYIYNNTSGNKGDVQGYWCSIAVIGNYPSPWVCEVKNNLGFNLTTNGKSKIAADQSNGTWSGDSSNNMYFNSPTGVVDPVTGIPTANSPVIGKGLSVSWITDDFYHNPRKSPQDIGAVQHDGVPQPKTNQPPVALINSVKTVNLPTDSAVLDGTKSYDPDGKIVKYLWTLADSSKTASISNDSASAITVGSLSAGTYVFKLVVTDDSNATAFVLDTITVTTTANLPPIANAGPDQTITLPTNSVSLDGSASKDQDNGGIISFYQWKQSSGPSGYNIVSPNNAKTTVTGLQAGVYVFQLTVTDNSGDTATDQVTITVNPKPATPNQAPIANAGSNITITAPANSVNLNGKSSFDPDGTIATYSWKEISGPATTVITNPTTSTPTISGLVTGIYVFELTVIDNGGASSKDQVTVTVNPEVKKANQLPVANAGMDTTIQQTTYELNASSSYDPDGTISSYQWQQIGGPATAEAVSMNNAMVALSGLQPGQYEFQLTVTDNVGATSRSTVILTVEQAAGLADQLLVYPNPVHDVLNQKITSDLTGAVKITIYDINGRLVQANQSEKTGNILNNRINVTSLATGTYMIVINISNRKTMVSKFIKQ